MSTLPSHSYTKSPAYTKIAIFITDHNKIDSKLLTRKQLHCFIRISIEIESSVSADMRDENVEQPKFYNTVLVVTKTVRVRTYKHARSIQSAWLLNAWQWIVVFSSFYCDWRGCIIIITAFWKSSRNSFCCSVCLNGLSWYCCIESIATKMCNCCNSMQQK